MTEKTTTYKITFDRIGRNHHVPPLTVTVVENADRAQAIAAEVFHYARPRLTSTEVNVVTKMDDPAADGTDPATGRGWITVGFHAGGEFIIAPVIGE